jgi:DNA-binding PadR family transcriptional regulator
MVDIITESPMPRLPDADFQILLALTGSPLHGSAVQEEVARRTAGETVLGPGTLYTSIKRMVESGLIAETEAAGRRRTYRITRAGWAAARAEAHRLAQGVRDARRARLLDDLGRV